MSMLTRAKLALMLLAGLAASPAQAALVSVEICAKFQVNYQEVGALLVHDPDLEGDYFYTNSNKRARGARITVRGGSVPLTQYSGWEGTEGGCATFQLDTLESYEVLVTTQLLVNGNYASIRDNDTDDHSYAFPARHPNGSIVAGWSPSASGTLHVHVAQHWATNASALAGFALARQNAGLANKTFVIYVDQQNRCSGSCVRDGKVYLSAEGVDSRVIMAHELGHAVDRKLTNRGSGLTDYDADPANCWTDTNGTAKGGSVGAHELISKEWQSAAIIEGWAHFYAAAVFNDAADNDCGFVYYKEQAFGDPGDNGIGLSHQNVSGNTAISCENGLSHLVAEDALHQLVDAYDYMGDYCEGTLARRATEFDWLRFWWDFYQEESTVTFEDCAEIFSNAVTGVHIFPPAGPWDADAGVNAPDNKKPGWRMWHSAVANGFQSEWEDHNEDHGVHR